MQLVQCCEIFDIFIFLIETRLAGELQILPCGFFSMFSNSSLTCRLFFHCFHVHLMCIECNPCSDGFGTKHGRRKLPFERVKKVGRTATTNPAILIHFKNLHDHSLHLPATPEFSLTFAVVE
jgi:hypothetical protein